MTFLTQANFPGLWKVFQYWIGGTVDKRRLCLSKYQGQRNILEVGCSVGNIAQAFLNLPNIRYTGLDIDECAIRHAKQSFKRHKNFTFIAENLESFTSVERKFDYLLFAGVCHHVNDESLLKMLSLASLLLSKDGQLIVVDPVLPEPSDPKFFSLFLKLEQGSNVRSGASLESLLRRANELTLNDSEYHFVASTPFAAPKCARFGLYVLKCKNHEQI